MYVSVLQQSQKDSGLTSLKNFVTYNPLSWSAAKGWAFGFESADLFPLQQSICSA